MDVTDERLILMIGTKQIAIEMLQEENRALRVKIDELVAAMRPQETPPTTGHTPGSRPPPEPGRPL